MHLHSLAFSTPLWQEGNAEAKHFMQPLAKVLKTAMITQRPWKAKLPRFSSNIVRQPIDPQVYLEQSYF